MRARMIEEGAAIVDVGGESTRPGAAAAPLDEELARVIPVIEALRRESDVFISVDTSKPEVMRAACDAGADIINDVRALTAPGALAAAASTRAGICLMHMQGEPRTMQQAPQYEDVVGEVARISPRGRRLPRAPASMPRGSRSIRASVSASASVDNLALLKHLARFEELGVAAGRGLSRKSMLANADRP